MKKFKIFTAGILAYLMLISLVPSNFLVKEVKALSQDYNIITKENSQVIGGYVYKNKILSVSFSLPGPLLLPGCAGAGSATPEQGCLKSHETCAFETSLFFTLLSYDSYL